MLAKDKEKQLIKLPRVYIQVCQDLVSGTIEKDPCALICTTCTSTHVTYIHVYMHVYTVHVCVYCTYNNYVMYMYICTCTHTCIHLHVQTEYMYM